VPNKIYAVGIGGSGSKCIEALAHISAVGLLGNADLKILLVDSDPTNGNKTNAEEVINICKRVSNILKEGNSKFMQGTFKTYPSWDPLEGKDKNRKLKDIFDFNSMQENDKNLASLFEALYSPDLRETELNKGFCAKPSIGSAVMSLPSPASSLIQFLKDIEDDASQVNNNVTVHVMGSVFGGTGAAGIPTLGRLIDDYLKGNRGKQDGNSTNLRSRVRLNASLLLPYFEFNRQLSDQRSIYAETQDFPVNTQAALNFLSDQQTHTYDRIYLVGNNKPVNYSFSPGNESQKNEANIVELYAALAVAHGIVGPINVESVIVSHASRASNDRFEWSDLPKGLENANAMEYLARATRFAYGWKYNIALELAEAYENPKKFSRGAPWFGRFFKSPVLNINPNIPSVKDEFSPKDDAITDWCSWFLSWMGQIGSTTADAAEEKLVQPSIGTREEKEIKYVENLSQIVLDDISMRAESDTTSCIDYLKNRLADIDTNKSPILGIHLLVHSFFNLF